MDTHSDQSGGVTNPRTRRRRRILTITVLVVSAIILAAILVPHNMVSRIAHDEANAMHSLRTLWQLESSYAAAHPSKGFTCDFAELKTIAPSDVQVQEGFLFSQTFEGYKFTIAGCEVDSKGVVVRYRATAVPLLPGKTGVRAFCKDQTGELLYGVDGTAASCRPL